MAGFSHGSTTGVNAKRPFFVFLNYLDAHPPYKLPAGATPRFGQMPRTRDELRIVYHDGA